MSNPVADHPHSDPGDGRTECAACGKWVFPVTHSCKRVPVTDAARARWRETHQAPEDPTEAAVARIREVGGTAAGTFAMLGYVDPFGQWWIAQLGTAAPDPDRAMPAAWQPVSLTPRHMVR